MVNVGIITKSVPVTTYKEEEFVCLEIPKELEG